MTQGRSGTRRAVELNFNDRATAEGVYSEWQCMPNTVWIELVEITDNGVQRLRFQRMLTPAA